MAKNIYLIKHHFQGPDNISINQLSVSDLEDMLSALKIADMYIPKETTQILAEKVFEILPIIYKSKRRKKKWAILYNGEQNRKKN